MSVSSTEWEDQRCAVIPLQQYCFMSQHFFSVKTWFRAPNVRLSEVTYLVSSITERHRMLACKNKGDLVQTSPFSKTHTCGVIWEVTQHATWSEGRAWHSPAKSRLTIFSGTSETRTTSLHLKDENLSIFALELFHLALSNSCLQLFHNNSNN